MGSYVPVTPEERRAMLERIGLPSVEALYADVPEGVLLKEPPVFTGGFSELEVRRHMERLAEQNRVFSTILRGAEKMLVALEERDILGGQPLGDGRVLWCVTEKAERKRLDEAVAVIREVTNL